MTRKIWPLCAALVLTACGAPGFTVRRPPAPPPLSAPSGGEEASVIEETELAEEVPGEELAAEGAPVEDAPEGADEAPPHVDALHPGGAEDGPEPEVEAEHDPATRTTVTIPLTDKEIADKVAKSLETLGSISVGSTNAGALINGVQMPKGDNWVSVSGGQAWGTQETIDALVHCIDAVAERFPNTPPLYIGDISLRRGGHMSPHLSHQAGRDVDLNYYLIGDAKWYTTANAKNLDVARTWAFVKLLIEDTDIEMIFMDSAIQRIVKEYAKANGEDPDWVDSIFQGSRTAIIRHWAGHATHLHLRFYSPVARETARRAYRYLQNKGLIKTHPTYTSYKVKKGDTLGRIAYRNKTTVKAIQSLNGMKNTRLRVGQVVRVAMRAKGVAQPSGPVTIPPRRVAPKAKPAVAGR